MRPLAALVLAAVLSAVGDRAGADAGSALTILRVTVREHLEPQPPDLYPDDPWLLMTNLDLVAALPRGFRIDPAVAPVPVELDVNGVAVWRSVSIAPKRRGRRWGAVPYGTPTSHQEFGRWFRARLDLRTRRLRFRDQFLDLSLIQGDPAAVPWRIRIGDKEFSGTIDFTAARPDLWRYRRPRARSIRGR